MKECLQCGNEVGASDYFCPYCGGLELEPSKGLQVHRLDLGHADLDVWTARNRLIDAALLASARGVDVLIVVHGYGSTGTGGAIRAAIRKEAASLERSGSIAAWVAGEDVRQRSGSALAIVQRFPEITSIPEWGYENPGLSILICR